MKTKSLSSSVSQASQLNPCQASGVTEANRSDVKHDEQSEQTIVETQVKPKSTRRYYTVAYKRKILAAYDALETAEERGSFLRKEGLYQSRITTWRQERDEGKLQSKSSHLSRKKADKLLRENKQLKRRLAQAEAIIDLQKKVSELLGTHILQPESSGEC